VTANLLAGVRIADSQIADSRMETTVTLSGLMKTALADGAVGFTFHSGLDPVIYFQKAGRTDDLQPFNV